MKGGVDEEKCILDKDDGRVWRESGNDRIFVYCGHGVIRNLRCQSTRELGPLSAAYIVQAQAQC